MAWTSHRYMRAARFGIAIAATAVGACSLQQGPSAREHDTTGVPNLAIERVVSENRPGDCENCGVQVSVGCTPIIMMTLVSSRRTEGGYQVSVRIRHRVDADDRQLVTPTFYWRNELRHVDRRADARIIDSFGTSGVGVMTSWFLVDIDAPTHADYNHLVIRCCDEELREEFEL